MGIVPHLFIVIWLSEEQVIKPVFKKGGH